MAPEVGLSPPPLGITKRLWDSALGVRIPPKPCPDPRNQGHPKHHQVGTIQPVLFRALALQPAQPLRLLEVQSSSERSGRNAVRADTQRSGRLPQSQTPEKPPEPRTEAT